MSREGSLIPAGLAGKKWLLAAVAVLVVLGGLLWQSQRPLEVAYLVVQEQEYSPSLVLAGEVVPARQIEISSRASGLVEQVLLVEGEIAARGQLIISLDREDAELSAARADAAVRAATASLGQARGQARQEAEIFLAEAELRHRQAFDAHERASHLFQEGAISQMEWDGYTDALSLAVGQLHSAKLRLESMLPGGTNIEMLEAALRQSQVEQQAAALQLDRSQIKAPADGLLLALNVSQGELVYTGQVIALMGVGDQARIRVLPDQRFINLTAEGNPALAWLSASPENKWPGQVIELESTGDPARGTRGAVIELEQAVPELVPGTMVSVQLFAGQSVNSIVLSDALLTVEDGAAGVWVAENNRARFVSVKTGGRSEAGVIILEGLSQGDVVLEPRDLAPNKRVSLRPEREL